MPRIYVMLFAMLAVLAGCGFGLAAASEDAPADAPEDAARYAYSFDGARIKVKPLGHPDNPYAGMYSAYDLWVFENYDTAQPETSEPASKKLPDGVFVYSSEVSAEGFLVPRHLGLHERKPAGGSKTVREMIEENMDRYSGAAKAGMVNHQYWLKATGSLPPEVEQARLLDEKRQLASYSLPIPAWLGENAPMQAIVMPTGEILCYGPLGLEVAQTEELENLFGVVPGFKWYRYSDDGKLLGQTGYCDYGSSQDWIKLYYTPPGPESGANTFYNMGDGTVIALKSGGGPASLQKSMEGYVPEWEFIAAYTYDGQPLGLDDKLPNRGNNSLLPISQDRLADIYQAQLELGITSADTTSPYWQQPGGPVIAQGPLTKLPLLARDSTPPEGEDEYVRVRDTASPDNPYSGQYADYDMWLHWQIGKRDPEVAKQREQQSAAMQAFVNEKMKEGKDITSDMLEQFRQPLVVEDSEWNTYVLRADGDGWILPMTQAWEKNSRIPLYYGPGDRGYTIQAGGIMPDELEGSYNQAKREVDAATAPPIPQWLAESPVAFAIAGPDGEWITGGELGSYTAAQSLEGRQLQGYWQSLLLHRYSADGELLEVAPEEGLEWVELYSDSAAQLLAELAPDGQRKVQVINGFIVAEELEIVGERTLNITSRRTFDWQGNEVGTAGLLEWDGRLGKRFSWDDISELYLLQQLSQQ